MRILSVGTRLNVPICVNLTNLVFLFGGVTVKVMDCRIVVSEFELQSRYYVHFRTNFLGKSINPLTLPAVG